MCVCVWETQKILSQDKRRKKHSWVILICLGSKYVYMMAAIEKPSRRVDSEAAGGRNDINNELCPCLLDGYEKHAAA